MAVSVSQGNDDESVSINNKSVLDLITIKSFFFAT
jgi:hypothetical protein